MITVLLYCHDNWVSAVNLPFASAGVFVVTHSRAWSNAGRVYLAGATIKLPRTYICGQTSNATSKDVRVKYYGQLNAGLIHVAGTECYEGGEAMALLVDVICGGGARREGGVHSCTEGAEIRGLFNGEGTGKMDMRIEIWIHLSACE
jgi:hypothetical protein